MAGAVRLDSKDFQILYELDQDSRQPASRIAKKAGLSQDSVNYRLRRMRQEGAVFKFMTILDTAKLGLTTYKVLFRLQDATSGIEQEMVEYLAKNSNVQLVSDCEGNFDLNANFLAPTVAHLQSTLDALNSRYGKYIADREIMVHVQSNFFYRDYLVPEKRRAHWKRKPVFFGSTPAPARLDSKDHAILSMLCEDSRTPLLEISRGIRLSPDSVALRIKKLEQAGIIQNYALVPRAEKLGFLWYYIMVKFSPTPDAKGFRSFCEAQPNIWYLGYMLGRWDAVLGLDVASPEEFKEILMRIKRDFSGSIREYAVLRLPRFIKWNMHPAP